VANDRHTVTVEQGEHDDFPYANINCPYDLQSANRPCATVDCPQCAEYSTLTCLDEGHDGAHVVDGICGYQEWHGNEAVMMLFSTTLRVSDVKWDQDMIVLTLKGMGQ
jgi:Zn ribbon nucleic-acid-binding protein